MFPLPVFPELVLALFDGDILQEVSIPLARRTLEAQLVEEWHDLQHKPCGLNHSTSCCIFSFCQGIDISISPRGQNCQGTGGLDSVTSTRLTKYRTVYWCWQGKVHIAPNSNQVVHRLTGRES